MHEPKNDFFVDLKKLVLSEIRLANMLLIERDR